MRHSSKLALIIMLMCSFLSNAAYAELGSSVGEVMSIFSETTYPDPIEVGDQDVGLRLIIQNNGAYTYSNIKVKADFPYPLSGTKIESTAGQVRPGNSITALFYFDVDENAEPGVYKVPVTITYSDTTQTITAKRNVYISISSDPRLEIRSLGFDTDTIAVGSDFEFTVDVENTGALPASNIMANLEFTGAIEPSIEFFPNLPITVNLIEAKSTGKIVFKGKVTPYSTTGGFPATLTIDYGGDEISYNFMFVVGAGSELDVTPIDNSVEPGKLEKAVFELRNRGSVSYSDVKLTMSQITNLAFLDNSIYVGDIGPNEVKNVEIPLISSRDLVDGIYSLTLNISSAQSTMTEQTNLIVEGMPVLELAGVASDIERPTNGQPLSFSVQLENVGTGDARSTKASLSCENIVGTPESYVGTVEIDDTGTAIFDIAFNNPGKEEMCVDLHFTDNSGREYEKKINFNFYVYSAPTDYSFVYVLILAAGVYWFLRRRKKLKAQLSKVI